MYFIYALIDTRTDAVGYIGITNNLERRLQQHLVSPHRNEQKEAWFTRLRLARIKPGIKVLEQVENKKQAVEREKYWIAEYLSRGIQLTNISHAKTAQKVNHRYPLEFAIDLDRPLRDQLEELEQQFNNPTGADLEELKEIFRCSLIVAMCDEAEKGTSRRS